MKLTRGLLLLGATCFAVASCERPESNVERGNRLGILHKGNGKEVQDLDPHVVNSVSAANIMMALLEGLVTEDPRDLRPVPGVAARWEVSPDARVYTFHLRPEARWSNGDPVTAQDFINSYRRILSPAMASDYAYMLFPVVNAERFHKGELADFCRGRLSRARSAHAHHHAKQPDALFPFPALSLFLVSGPSPHH